MLLERGIAVSYETIRRWGRKHGPDYARRIRRKPPSGSDVWYLDEVAVRINSRKCWLWRAVDQDGYVLDEIAQVRRNTKAARRLLTRLMKKSRASCRGGSSPTSCAPMEQQGVRSCPRLSIVRIRA
jgi:putative transposase